MRNGEIEGPVDFAVPGGVAGLAVGPEHPLGQELGVLSIDYPSLVFTRTLLPSE
jgi:hypothetical protein